MKNSFFNKILILPIAFLCPFLSFYTAAWVNNLVLQGCIIFLWSATSFLAIYLKMTTNKKNKVNTYVRERIHFRGDRGEFIRYIEGDLDLDRNNVSRHGKTPKCAGK